MLVNETFNVCECVYFLQGCLATEQLLGNMFEEGIHSLHEPKSVLSIFSMRGGGAFTMSLADVVVGSVDGVVLTVLCVLQWV